VRIQTLRFYENTDGYRSLGTAYFLVFTAVRRETAVTMENAGTGERYRIYSYAMQYDITAHKTVLKVVANHCKSTADTKFEEFPAV
jgi:hypothetical protein